jgi:hypothetical protein
MREASERLFDPETTVPTWCTVLGCGAIRLPGQTVVPTCNIDKERALGNWRFRPTACLNAYDPATAAWPEGF